MAPELLNIIESQNAFNLQKMSGEQALNFWSKCDLFSLGLVGLAIATIDSSIGGKWYNQKKNEGALKAEIVRIEKVYNCVGAKILSKLLDFDPKKRLSLAELELYLQGRKEQSITYISPQQ